MEHIFTVSYFDFEIQCFNFVCYVIQHTVQFAMECGVFAVPVLVHAQLLEQASVYATSSVLCARERRFPPSLYGEVHTNLSLIRKPEAQLPLTGGHIISAGFCYMHSFGILKWKLNVYISLFLSLVAVSNSFSYVGFCFELVYMIYN